MDDRVIALDPWRAVCNALRGAIVAGEYPPGSRLVERDLAERFGTSRGPVRTALKELERTGLVELIPRRGSFVRTLAAEDVEEIFSLWEVMWSFALRRVVANITPDELARLREFQSRVPALDDVGALAEFSLAFHREVFRIAKHQRALDIFEGLVSQAQSRLAIAEGARHWQELGFGRDIDVVCDAIANGDAEAAIAPTRLWVESMAAALALPGRDAPSGERAKEHS